MESKYRVEFSSQELNTSFKIEPDNQLVILSRQVKDLREDLRSIVIDEAIRAGEELEKLIQLPADKKKGFDLKAEACQRARQVSVNRYGDLCREAFQKLKN